MKFSQRYGYTPVKAAFQRECVSTELRIALWNVLKTFLWDKWEPESYRGRIACLVEGFQIYLWDEYFRWDKDERERFDFTRGSYARYKQYFMGAPWVEVFDFIEFVIQHAHGLADENCVFCLNRALEHFNSAYRLVGDQVVEITDEIQIEAIEAAVAHPVDVVREHFAKAVTLMANRDKPDFANSIKESISAVEAAVCRASGAKTLGAGLKKLKGIHPALLLGWQQLYGFTCDAKGIRHGSFDSDFEADYESAKYMLVTCSAFASYLASMPAIKVTD